ncbi:hypothetical protein CEP53_006180 [Fusarium sp. AF-6]|nr:hypothetical protein CEP53_006180 [Fusarium sp. AF-6]
MARKRRAGSFDGSPYYGATCKFQFKGGAIACVPREVINKYPDLAGLADMQPDDKPITFSDVTERVGHMILHFLFTGTYETLPQPSDDKTVDPIAAFTEAVQVYHEAVINGLDELTELATVKIVQQGEVKTFSSIVKGLSRVSGVFEGDKTWLIEYLADRAAMAYETVSEEDISKLQDIDYDHTLVDILFKANVKLKVKLQQAEDSDGSSME